MSDRRLDEIIKQLSKYERQASDYGEIYDLFNNYADIRMGNSPTLLKNVPIQGDSDSLYVGQKVRVEWTEKDGNPDRAPFISGAGGDFISGQGGASTVTVDEVTITKGYVGLSVKRGGIGTQHLNFLPSMDGHTHKTPLELGGWLFTDDGIMYTDYMYIHPDGMMKIGGGYPNEDDVIVLDSLDSTYRLWAGDQSPSAAPFSVSKAGAIKATSGEIAGWTIDASKIAGGGIEMYSAGYIQSNPYTAGLVGFRIDDDVAEFNNVRVRGELRTTVFVYDELHANAGTLGVFPSAGVLLNDVTISGSCNVDIKDPDTGHAQLFSSGDRLRIKDGSGNDTWLTVSSVSDQTTFYRYVCAYASGTNSVTYRAGAAVVDYGASGDGYLTLSADGGVGSSPNITLATHGGSPWSGSNVTLIGRIGNLNGSFGHTSDAYGFAFGDYDDEKYIMWDNSSSTLVISGTVRIGQGSGFSTPAILHLPYDGPAPVKKNFDVHTAGHLGQMPTVQNNASGWFGKWHKAGRFAYSTTNRVENPRFAVNTNSWTLTNTGTGGTMTRVTTKSFIGDACLDLKAGTAQTRAESDAVSVSSSMGIRIQARIFVEGSTASNGYIVIRETSTGTTRATATATKTNEWELIDCGYYNNVATYNYEVWLVNNANDSSTHVYFDAVMMETDTVSEDKLTPYADGSFPGCTWSGTEHDSNSTLGAVDMYYEDFDFPETNGTVSMWVNTTIDMDDGLSILQYINAYNGVAGMALYISTSQYLYAYLGSSGVSYQLTSTNFPKHTWHHLALTWNKTADEFKLYLNGVQVGSTGNYGTFVEGNRRLYVGNVSAASNFYGYIDDYALIGRTLTDQEIRQIYESDTPLNVSGRNFGLYISEQGAGKVVGEAGLVRAYDPDENFSSEISANGVRMSSNAAGYAYSKDFIIEAPNDGGTMFKIQTYWASATAHYTTLEASNNASRDNDLTVKSAAGMQIETTLASEQIRLKTNAGYIDLGPMNTTWCHINTDRSNFYFYKGFNVVGSGVAVTSATETPPGAGNLQVGSYLYWGDPIASEMYYDGSSWLRLNQNYAKNVYTVRLFRADGGLVAGNSVGAANDITYRGNLRAHDGTTYRDVYAVFPLQSEVGSANFLGTGKGNTSGSYYTVSSEFSGVPSAAKGVFLSCTMKYSSAGAWVEVGVSSSYRSGLVVYAPVANQYNSSQAFVPCDSSGRIYIKTSHSSMEIWLRCTSYIV